MKVGRNSYYHWSVNKDLVKAPNNKELKEKIRALFYKNRAVHGSARIQKMPEREGRFYARSYMARLMGLRSILKKGFVSTTGSDHNCKTAENVLNPDHALKNLLLI